MQERGEICTFITKNGGFNNLHREVEVATEKKNDDGACMEDVAMHYENQEPLEESVDVN